MDVNYKSMKKNLKERINSKKEKNIESILSNIKFLQDLTSREFEIMNEFIKGDFNEEIAFRLFISINTLKTHRRNINKKLNIGRLYGGSNHEAILINRQQIYTRALEIYLNSKSNHLRSLGVTSHKR